MFIIIMNSTSYRVFSYVYDISLNQILPASMILQLMSQNWKLDTDFMSLLYYSVTFYNKITLKFMQVFQRYITISTYINILGPKIG